MARQSGRLRRRPPRVTQTCAIKEDAMTIARLTRRDFIKTSAAAGILTAAGAAPAFAQGTRLHFLQWSHFIPAADQVFEEQAKEFGKQAGVEIAIERINQNDIQARLTAAIQSASGPDIVVVANNHALLYESSLVDVTDVAEEIGRDRKSVV